VEFGSKLNGSGGATRFTHVRKRALVLVSALCLGGCGAGDSLKAAAPAATPPGFTEHKSAKDKFSLALPKGMKPIDSEDPEFKKLIADVVSKNPQMGNQVAQIAKSTNFALYALDFEAMRRGAPFVDNVNVIHKSGAKVPPMTMQSAERIRDGMVAQIPGMRVLKTELVDLPTGKSIHLVTEMKVNGLEGGASTARSEGFYLGAGNEFYVVTYTSGDDKRSAEFRQSVETFRVTE